MTQMDFRVIYDYFVQAAGISVMGFVITLTVFILIKIYHRLFDGGF